MRIRASDYLMLRFARLAAPLLRRLGDWESAWLAPQLGAMTIDRPVFIAGLARSGTTVLLEILAKLGGFATHRYRDFPFVMIPYLWNRYLDLFPAREKPVERPHKDRIYITRESPEAFEEPIWEAFFPGLHGPRPVGLLAGRPGAGRFERFYREHVKKIVLVRKGRRYLSKGNYNLARIEYLAGLFPDARFIVPVRHPATHVYSLVRQHRLFVSYSSDDPRVPRWLSAAGHYEFGPQRAPVRFSDEGGKRIDEAWGRGDDFGGYAIQWAEAYRFVGSLLARGGQLSQRILVVRYEDLCADPKRALAKVLWAIGVEPEKALAAIPLDHISPSTAARDNLDQKTRDALWREAAAVAGLFGYDKAELPARPIIV